MKRSSHEIKDSPKWIQEDSQSGQVEAALKRLRVHPPAVVAPGDQGAESRDIMYDCDYTSINFLLKKLHFEREDRARRACTKNSNSASSGENCDSAVYRTTISLKRSTEEKSGDIRYFSGVSPPSAGSAMPGLRNQVSGSEETISSRSETTHRNEQSREKGDMHHSQHGSSKGNHGGSDLSTMGEYSNGILDDDDFL